MSLGVLNDSLYPIIVAVSVLTIFTTPYFIKMADSAYTVLERHLPSGLNFLINRYAKQVVDTNETRRLWRAIIKRYLWRIVLYSVILLAMILISRNFLFPIMENLLKDWGHLIATIITMLAMSPILVAMSFSTTKPDERIKLHQSASFYDVPLVAMRIVRYLIGLFFIVYFVTLAYSTLAGWLVGVGCFMLLIIVSSSRLAQHYHRMEVKFMNNLNSRENTRLGTNNNLVEDLHQAYIEVRPTDSYVGDRLCDSGLRRDYGVSVSSIQRGDLYMPLPSKDARIFPGDILGVIGTDEQLKTLNEDLESAASVAPAPPAQHKVELQSILLTPNSPIINKKLAETNIGANFYSMLLKVRHADGSYEQPTADTILREGDLIWVVGDPSGFEAMKGA